MKLKKLFLAAGLTAAATVSVTAQKAPEPCGLTPSARQIEWYNREMIAFFHFGINTFEDFVNEGDGKASTAILRAMDANPKVSRHTGSHPHGQTC